jgi:DNA polymerase-3 subunit alpha
MLWTSHSWFSLRYGLMPPQEIAKTAAQLGLSHIALTDILNTSGVWDFVRAAEKHGVQPICGVTFKNQQGEVLFHAIAQNNVGYEEICSSLTAHLNNKGHHMGERAPEAWRSVHVIYPWQQYCRNTAPFTDLNPWEWVGVQAWEVPQYGLKCAQNPAIANRCVAMHNLTFRYKRDWNCHRILRAIDCNALLSQMPSTANAHPQQRVMPRAEVEQAFENCPLLIENGDELVHGCSINLPSPANGRMHNNQHTYTESEESDDQLIRSLCAEGLAYRYPDHAEHVVERMEMELEVIRKQGYLAYFLINWDITSYARSQGYFHVGRGSGANSLVAYLLRITDVDPIELDLYFERFINLYRTNPPDFDIDFSWTDRDDVTRYIFERFEHVALVGAYNTFQFRAVIRELGKVFGLPKHEIDVLASGKFNPNKLGEIEQIVVEYATHLRDFPNALTIHACGILIADRPISHFCGTFLPPKGYPTTQFDMIVAEDVGLYKFDILSQRGLGKIRDAIDWIARNDPEGASKIDIHDMRRFKADEDIKRLLRDALAVGCFYVESPAMRMLMRKLRVDTYLGLVAASSVIRPGVARSGMMKAYIERHRFPEKRQEAHPILHELMPETYGVMVYQEDVIKVAHHYAGLDLGEADVLRRGMSGKFRSREEFARAKDAFIAKALAKGRTAGEVEEVWRQVESFAGYAFAKGHSASYAVESYQSLFLKAHWPLEYMTACINNFGGFYRTEFYVHEARMLGAIIEPPCVNEGDWEAVCMRPSNRLVLGFNLVKGIEHTTVHRITKERMANGPFQSLEHCVQRVPGLGIEQTVILIRCGAFRFTGVSKQALLWEAYFLLGHMPKGKTSATLFTHEAKQFELPPLASGTLEDAFDELELFGFSLSPPFHLLTEAAKQCVENALPAAALQAHANRRVVTAGHLVTAKETATAKGERMAFGCFLDKDGQWLDSVHFPPQLKRFPFRGPGIYLIEGLVQEEYGCYHVVADRLAKLDLIEDPRYSEAGAPVREPRPSNRSVMAARRKAATTVGRQGRQIRGYTAS